MDDEHQFPVLGLSLKAVLDKEEAARSEGARDSRLAVVAASPLERVQKLVWIKGNTYYKEALDDWERQEIKFKGRLERWEKRAEELTNQVYNVVGFFSVFQGVILTAVTQLNSQATATPARPLCNKVWYPLILSLLAAVAAGFGIGLKFADQANVDKTIGLVKSQIVVAERRQAELQKLGARFTFTNLPTESASSPRRLYRLFRRIAVIVLLFVFTGIFCLSYFAILCDKLVPQIF